MHGLIHFGVIAVYVGYGKLTLFLIDTNLVAILYRNPFYEP